MEDYIQTSGQSHNSRPDAGKAVLSPLPVIGIVKDNIDPNRSGRIKVFLTNQANLDVDPDDSENWESVSCLSSFFGSVRPTSSSEGFGEYKSNGSSYGEWHAPPDIGTKVVCIFIEGKPEFGYYIGCIPDAESLYMVPAIGSAENFVPNDGEADALAGVERAPVTNINLNDKGVADTEKYLDHPRPVHSYTTAIMSQQGIIRDPVRGPISSSSQREAASRVGWGVCTPGRPIYQGGLSDSTVTENLDTSAPGNAEKLRVISRRGGHSIVMDDGDLAGRDQLIRIRTALGHQILMSDDGQTLMLLHSNGQSYIELGAEGTVDVYASNSINMRTDGDINFHAKRDINFHSNSNIKMRANDMHFDALFTMKVRADAAFNISTFGNFTVKADAKVALQGLGGASLQGSKVDIVGARINLNSGLPTQPPSVEEIPLKKHPETVFDEEKGFFSTPDLLETIVSRAPTHAPWAEAGKGVDVSTSFSAADNLPSSSSSGISRLNNLARNASSIPTRIGTNLAVPNINYGNKLDPEAAAASFASIATNTLSTAPSVSQFGFSVNPSVGSFAQTPGQLASAGYIKPGSDKLVNIVAGATGNLTQAMPGSIFAGKPGADNFNSLLSNPSAQAASLATNFQKSEQTLIMAGAISGNEAPEQIAGIVAAGAVHGSSEVLNALQEGTAGAPIQSERVLKTIGSVSNNVSSVITQGEISGISEAGIGSASGFKKSSFNSIKDSLTSKIPGVPNVNPPKSIPGIPGLSGGASGVIAKLAGSASEVAAGLVNSSAIANATGFSNLPGGVSQAMSQVDLSVGNFSSAVNKGVSQLSNLSAGGISSALNNVSAPAGLTNAFAKAGSLEGLAKGALGSISASSALSAGLSAISRLGRSKRKPIAALNTVGREILSNQVNAVLSDLVVRAVAPKFDQSLEEREEEIKTAEQAIAEREEAARKASEFKRDLREVAEKYREERLSAQRNTDAQEQTFSIGSPERISAIRQQIDVLENSPHRENGLKIIEESLSFAKSTGDQSFEREIEKRKALFKGSEFNAEVNRLRRKLNQELAETKSEGRTGRSFGGDLTTGIGS